MRMSYPVIVLVYNIKSPIAVLWHCTKNMSHFASTAGGARRVLGWFHSIVDGRSFCVAHYWLNNVILLYRIFMLNNSTILQETIQLSVVKEVKQAAVYGSSCQERQ